MGLATAQELIVRHPNLKFAVLEKENELSLHQVSISATPFGQCCLKAKPFYKYDELFSLNGLDQCFPTYLVRG